MAAASFRVAVLSSLDCESDSDADDSETDDALSLVVFAFLDGGSALDDASESDAEDSDELSGCLRFKGFAATGTSATTFLTTFLTFAGFSCSSSASLSEDEDEDEELEEELEEELDAELLFFCRSLTALVFGFRLLLLSDSDSELEDDELLDELLDELVASSSLASLLLLELDELEMDELLEPLALEGFVFHPEYSCSSVVFGPSACESASALRPFFLSSFAKALDVDSKPC